MAEVSRMYFELLCVSDLLTLAGWRSNKEFLNELPLVNTARQRRVWWFPVVWERTDRASLPHRRWEDRQKWSQTADWFQESHWAHTPRPTHMLTSPHTLIPEGKRVALRECTGSEEDWLHEEFPTYSWSDGWIGHMCSLGGTTHVNNVCVCVCVLLLLLTRMCSSSMSLNVLVWRCK